MTRSEQSILPLETGQFRAGMRVGVAVSGGADSTALLLALAEKHMSLGIVLTVLHVQHGIRGEESLADAQFVEELTRQHHLRFLRKDVDTPGRAAAERETMEEAARSLRYAWFDALLASRELDAVATAHTLNDQAETVLLKLLRGAWTEGLAGIFPVVERPAGGVILRPLLQTSRSEIEAWLRSQNQPWREDATNRDHAYTRNRVRHDLLPALVKFNPQVVSTLSNMAAIARDEGSYWQGELARILPSLLLPGRAVRGGGRSTSTLPGEGSIAIEVERLRALHPALRRRVLRAAAEQLGYALNFDQTETLLSLITDKAGRREELAANLRAERTPRELQLLLRQAKAPATVEEYSVPVPGEIEAKAFGFSLKITLASEAGHPPALLRVHRAGDRVRLRYTHSLKRVKELLERMQVPSSERSLWPVLEWQGEIIWMRGAEIENDMCRSLGLKVETKELR